jgi:outer membrane protein assembly factor BamA
MLDGHRIIADPIIYRELDIQAGNTILLSFITEDLNRNKKRLLRTGVFNIVEVNIKNWDMDANILDIHFTLNENWYIYPSLIWEYGDRSFNVWWKDFRFIFNRTNYGLSMDHLNLTGHKDRIKSKCHRGFTQKYEAMYSYPYFLGNWGLGGTLFYSENKEMCCRTEANHIVFFKTRRLTYPFKPIQGRNFIVQPIKYVCISFFPVRITQ